MIFRSSQRESRSRRVGATSTLSAMPETLSLFKTEHFHLGLSRCSRVPQGLSEEEAEPNFTVVFPISGVFVHHVEHRRTVATPAMALFLNRDDVHQVSHPTGGNDQSVFISLSTSMVEPFLDHAGRKLSKSATPTRPSTFLEVRNLVQRAASGGLQGLDLEDFALTTMVELLHGPPSGSPSEHHRALVADAEEYLSVHFRDKSTLDMVARHIGASPHHLSRLFRSVTGENLSTRRTQLRLRYAASQLWDGATDISEVAVEAGFYDHAHLTNTMRRHLGFTPSQIRAGKPRHYPSLDAPGQPASSPQPVHPHNAPPRAVDQTDISVSTPFAGWIHQAITYAGTRTSFGRFERH